VSVTLCGCNGRLGTRREGDSSTKIQRFEKGCQQKKTVGAYYPWAIQRFATSAL
jgi:hypothetical protein